MNIPTVLFADAYKIGHVDQYPKGTSLVYSNRTARGSRLDGIQKMVHFSLQGFIINLLINHFNNEFFFKPKQQVVDYYHHRVKNMLGRDRVEHIEALHELGYLPLKIKSLPEGVRVPMRIPHTTIQNTRPEFFWLTNALETLMECETWGPANTATLAFDYRVAFEKYAALTGGPRDFVKWQGHDFSMRGMWGVDAAAKSGAGHLLSFLGTDTVPAIDYLYQFYFANSDKELVGASVPATEHSVMCMGMQESELSTFENLIFNIYPSGIVSIVSDTWDLWRVLTEYLPALKDRILQRDGKVVIRPDSGNPADILCGDPRGFTEASRKGVIELLWDVFGGTTNAAGYKELDPHVGAIYGDSITRERRDEILERLRAKGFASTNVVLGIGSFTYTYNTRDTFGQAMKSTFGVVNGQPRNISKNPVTDTGLKKSASGLLRVDLDSRGEYVVKENVTPEEESGGCLQTVFENGILMTRHTLAEIRARIEAEVEKELVLS